jgi:heme/copper-type cytochrome/quinol oxidase subunit 3
LLDQNVKLMRPQRSVTSAMRIFLISLLASFSVLAAALILQWVIYDDWLHSTGPVRIVGTSIAAMITFGFMVRWQYAMRERQREMIRRFELISHMNDRIRNAIQAIECVTYISYPQATETVRREVDAIDEVLRAVLSDATDRSAQKSINASGK